jgi:integrase
MNVLTLQSYFSRLGPSPLSADVVLKQKEVLSSVLGSALRYDLLVRNPMLQVKIPKAKVVNRRKAKPFLTMQEFHKLLLLVEEPYSSMIFVNVFTGLRISELLGLHWEDVGENTITVRRRCCRGDWSVTKTTGSSATIAVHPCVIERLQRLRTLEVDIRWGANGANKRFKVVRSAEPRDVVFQALRTGSVMHDQNILRRHLRPAAIQQGIDPKKATWRSLRTSCATWMIQEKADPKAVQAQMRHSRISTTLELYAQVVPASQREAVQTTGDSVLAAFLQSGLVQ